MKDAPSAQPPQTAAAACDAADSPPDEQTPRPGRAPIPWCIAVAALFVVSFAVLSWPFRYVIALQGESPQCFFAFGRQSLQGFLSRPGGLLEYAGRFLGQFYEQAWLGAVVASACIAGFGALLGGVVVRLRGAVSAWQLLLPGFLLLALHTSPAHLLHQALGLIGCCAVFLGYLSMPNRGARYAYAFVATPVAYLVLGANVWLFVVWVVLTSREEDVPRSDLGVKALYALYGLAVPLVAYRWFFLISLRDALTAPLNLEALATWGSVAGAVDGLLTVALIAALFAVPFGHRLPWRRDQAARLAPGRRTALGVELAALAVLVLVVRYDSGLSTFVACRQLYRHRQWDALLDKSRATASADLLMQFMTNFALAHQRKLLDEMFRYPQPFGTRGLALNFVTWQIPDRTENDTERALYNSDLYYEMGHVNAAFRHAYNHLVAVGETYAAYERMAQCNLVNANYDLAAKYLNILGRTTFHRGFARRYQAIAADPKAAAREFGGARRRLPRVELPMYQSQIAPAITLLQTDPDNRLAFDYVTAWSLLGKDLAGVCPDMEVYKAVGYPKLPIHCQEALLLIERGTGAPAGHGLSYDSAVTSRVNRFFEDLSRYASREDGLLQLQRSYGDTYLYYYFFLVTPAQLRQMSNWGAAGTARQE